VINSQQESCSGAFADMCESGQLDYSGPCKTIRGGEEEDDGGNAFISC